MLTTNFAYFKDAVFNLPRPLLLFLGAWTLFWKGYGLWKAGRNNQKYWFVALVVLNTLGILDIAYVSFFQKNLNNKGT